MMDEVGRRRWQIECELARLDERLTILEIAAAAGDTAPVLRLACEAPPPLLQETARVDQLEAQRLRLLQVRRSPSELGRRAHEPVEKYGLNPASTDL